jgi:hypothetical protein
MSADKYVLDERGEPRHEPDIVKWAAWFEGAEATRTVAYDAVGTGRVSTVFLGIDHSFGRGAPLLWETMIFDVPGFGPRERYTRYTSRRAAVEGHARAVQAAKEALA